MKIRDLFVAPHQLLRRVSTVVQDCGWCLEPRIHLGRSGRDLANPIRASFYLTKRANNLHAHRSDHSGVVRVLRSPRGDDPLPVAFRDWSSLVGHSRNRLERPDGGGECEW